MTTTTTYYFDVDGVLADFHSAYDSNNRAKSLTYDFIYNLKPFTKNVELVNELIANGVEVYISTMVATETTRKARIAWVNKYIPTLDNDHIITLLKGKKCDFMKTEDGILVDDKQSNCKQWEKAGHKAIWLAEKGEEIHL